MLLPPHRQLQRTTLSGPLEKSTSRFQAVSPTLQRLNELAKKEKS